jgi:hypothetical protein
VHKINPVQALRTSIKYNGFSLERTNIVEKDDNVRRTSKRFRMIGGNIIQQAGIIISRMKDRLPRYNFMEP